MKYGNDDRFDTPYSKLYPYPYNANPVPGTSPYSSNLATWHTDGSNFVFTDGHAKYYKRGQTYKPDGSFSMWTLSNLWFYYTGSLGAC